MSEFSENGNLNEKIQKAIIRKGSEIFYSFFFVFVIIQQPL